MSIQLQFRRGNTAQTAVFTGAVAELTVDSDKNTVILHDGVTAGGYALARESSLTANQAFAQQAYNKANAAYDAANTKYSSSGGTIAGNVIVTGNVNPTTDNVYSLGSASYRWKDIFVGAGTIDIDGVKLSKTNNQLVISGATDLVLSGTNVPSSSGLANTVTNAFNQANLAYDAANTAYTAGGARAFDQANLAFNKANSAWDYANSAYATANNEILTRQANVGEAVITITGAYQANVGAGLIANKLDSDANVGAGLISLNTSVTNAYQENVGAGLITVTNAYQANVGQLRLDTDNANTSLAANIGAARIADQSSSQANVGAGLITVTDNYQANVGQLRLDSQNANTSLAANIGAARIADTASAQANVGAARIISLGRANSAFAQANLAYNRANSGFDLATSGFAQANLAYNRANSAWDHANNAYAHANTKLSSSGGTISGDLSVTGNLTITGNTTTINVASLAITDTIIQLGIENLNDTLDIGFVGHYANTPNNHTGLVRRAADGKYYLFDNFLTDEPGNIIDFANTRVATLSANLVTNVITLRGVDPLDYANTIQTASQANVGAAVISITSAYQANVGAARIADQATSQANVGSGLIALNISVTNDYQSNVGSGLIALNTSITNAYQANVGSGLIANKLASDANVGAGLISLSTSITSAYQANVGAGLITVTNNYQANVGQLRLDAGNANTSLAANIGAARIADTASAQANVGSGLIALNTSVTNAYQANVGSGLIANKLASDANVGSAIAQGQANVGVGFITVTNAYQANVGAARIADQATSQANVGAGLITVTNNYQANVGAGLITKVAKAGDTMTGTLSTSGTLIGSSLTSNNIVTVNTHSVYEATAVTTGNTAQFTLDSFSTTAFRSAKYLVQVTSGSSYELLEMTLIHDGTTVYLSQYGNIKTGATLAVFDASISAGTLSVVATPNNAITTFKTAATLIAT